MHSLFLLAVAALVTANPVDIARLNSRQTPSQITIGNLVVSGSGCPAGSVTQSLSPDGTIVTLGFDDFQTYIGPGFTLADSSKNCQIHLNLNYPGGFTYSIVDAVYHGYAQLDPGVSGTFLSTYFFSQSATNSATTRSTISGATWLDGNTYTKEDQVPTAATIWSPCGDVGILNINNRISLAAANKTASGSVTDDDATVAFQHQIHIAWQACTQSTSSKQGSTVLVPRQADQTGPDSTTSTGDFWIGSGATTVTEDGTTEYGGGSSDKLGVTGSSTTTVTSGRK